MDVLLFMDIVEHIEDYLGLLRRVKDRGIYKAFNFPLEIYAAKSVVSGGYLKSRKKYGHLHYFNKKICLDALSYCGYTIVDCFYALGAIGLANTSTSVSKISKMAKIPRKLMSLMSVGITAKVLGGCSLLVLAK